MKVIREFSPISIVLETNEDLDRFRRMIDWTALESHSGSEVEKQAFAIQRKLNEIQSS